MKKITAFLSAALACILAGAPAFAVTGSAINSVKPVASQPQEAVQAPVNVYEESGKGSKKLENISLDLPVVAAHFTHTGSGTFAVLQSFGDGTSLTLIDTADKCNDTVFTSAYGPITLHIVTEGEWTAALNPGAYWDGVGTARHLDISCTGLQETTRVFGSVAEAEAAGKIAWCQICTDGQGNQPVAAASSAAVQPSTVPKTAASKSTSSKSTSGLENLQYAPSTNEITGELGQTAYWTQGGKSYHFSRDCTSLKRSKTVKSGTLQDALGAGKNDPCNLCAGG